MEENQNIPAKEEEEKLTPQEIRQFREALAESAKEGTAEAGIATKTEDPEIERQKAVDAKFRAALGR